MTVTVRSFAKINLGLRIGAPRPDGFHDLLTVYQTIALHDIIRVSVRRGSGIEIQCDDSRVPCDDSNTCYRIVERALRTLRATTRVVIQIEKRLPVQGGLGGASANAVSALLGLERALKKSLSAADRFRIAAEVGSDLPLFLIGGAVFGIGRGEQVYPLPDFPAIPCVIVMPEIGVSTPEAFAAWDRIQTAGLPSAGPTPPIVPARAGIRSVAPSPRSGKLTVSSASDRMNVLGRGLSAWLSDAFLGQSYLGQSYSGAPSHFLGRGGRAGNPLLWLVRAGIENDFEQVVFPEYPKLREGKRALERAGARYASLSGSGSALYGLFASRQAAKQAAVRLGKQGWTAQATVTLPRPQYWQAIFDR